MDEAGVDAGVIHPPADRDPTSGAFAIEAAKNYPDRFDIMGQFPPENPDNVRLIHGWRKQPGMMGLRWAMLYRDQPKMIVDGKFDWIWAATEKKGLGRPDEALSQARELAADDRLSDEMLARVGDLLQTLT